MPDEDNGGSRVDELWEDGFDRRRFLVSGLAGVVGGGLLTGSALAAANRSQLRHVAGTAEAAASNIHTVSWTAIAPPQNFDVDGALAIFIPNQHIWQACYDGLTQMVVPTRPSAAKKQADTRGYPAVPQLATSWEISADRLTYRFHLRRGVKSIYGHELSADDVVWTVAKGFNAKAGAAALYTGFNLSDPTHVKAIDQYTVDFKLDAPTPFILLRLANYQARIMDSTQVKKYATASDPYGRNWLATNVAGYGPYSLQRFQPGERAVMTRRKDYWGPKPKINTLIVSGVPDSNSRLQLLLAGAADFADQLSPLQLQAVAKNPGTHVLDVTSAGVLYLVMNNTKSPFNTPQLRGAIARAIPYADIIKTVFHGQAKPWKSLLTPWYPGATDKYWNYATNLAAAKAGLASVAGTSVTLNYRATDVVAQQMAILVGQALGKAGLNVQLQGLVSAIYDQRKVRVGTTPGSVAQMDFFLSKESPSLIDPVYVIQFFINSTGRLNAAGYLNASVDSMYAELVSLDALGQNIPRQKQLVDQIQKVAMADLPYIPIVYTGDQFGTVKDLEISALANPGATLDPRFFVRS